MSGIPPNIAGSIFQAQVSANETAQRSDAQKNKQIRDSRKLARLSEQQQQEVENADHAENLVVHRQDERERDQGDARDVYEKHEKNNVGKLYHADDIIDETAQSEAEESDTPPGDNENHIDLSA